jgi:hypothetical protein
MSVQKINALASPLASAQALSLAAWVERVRDKLALARAARRHARDSSELIALARRYESTQPEFAKDLFAAARNDRR